MSDLSRKPEFVREVRRLIRREYRRPWWTAWAVLLVVAFAGVAYAAIVLTQTLPATPAGTAAAATSTCTSLTASASTTIIGQSGTVVYSCQVPANTPALNLSGASTAPSFTLPVGAGSLDLITFGSGAAGCATGHVLQSGSAIIVPAGGYDYCLGFSSYPSAGFAAFTVQWSQ